MKLPSAWLEPSVVVTGLIAWMLIVMWTQRTDSGCVLNFEQPRRLVLSRETDREHLATDVASASRIARREMRAGEAAGQPGRFLECETTLLQQIATRHSVSRDAMPRSGADAE